MSKRGNPFPPKHGEDASLGIDYSQGTLNTPDDPPQRATAAQLASRKMAAPKNKRSTSRTPSAGTGGFGAAFGAASTANQSFPPSTPSQNNPFSSQSFPAPGADTPAQSGFSSNSFSFTGAGGIKNPFAQAGTNGEAAAPSTNGVAPTMFSTPSSSQTPTFSFGQTTATAASTQAPTTAFSGFGANTPSQGNMFGQNTGSSGFSFGQTNANTSVAPAFGGGPSFGQTTASSAPATANVGGFQFGKTTNVFGQQPQTGSGSTTEGIQPVKSMFTTTGNQTSALSNASTPQSAPQQISSTASSEGPQSNIFSQPSASQNQNGFVPTPSSSSTTATSMFNFGIKTTSGPAVSTSGFTFGTPAPAANEASTTAATHTPSPTEDAMHTSPDFNRTATKDHEEANDSSQPSAIATPASVGPFGNFFPSTHDKSATQADAQTTADVSKSKEQSNGFKPDLFPSKLAGANLFAPKPSVAVTASAQSEKPEDTSRVEFSSATPKFSPNAMTPAKSQSDAPSSTGFTPFAQGLKANSGPNIFSGPPSTSSASNTSTLFSLAPKTNISAAAPATPVAQTATVKTPTDQQALSSTEDLLKAPAQPSSRLNAEQQQRFRRNIAMKGLNEAFRELIDQKQEWSDLSTIMAWYHENAMAIQEGREPKAPSDHTIASAAEKTLTKRKGAEMTKETNNAASTVKKTRTDTSSTFTPRFGQYATQPPATSNAPNGSLFSTGSPVKRSSRDESARTPHAFGNATNNNKRRSPEPIDDDDTNVDSASKRAKAGDSTAVKLFESALSAQKDTSSTKSNFFQSGKFGTPSASSSRGTSVFEDPAQHSLTSTNNIFGHVSNLSKDGSDKENQGDTDDEEDDDEDEEEPPAKKPTDMAPTSNGGSDSETSKTSGRSLMSRITAPVAPPADATGDATSADEQSKPFSPSFGGDQTWKLGSPVKFGVSQGSSANGVSTPKEAYSTTPVFKFSAPSPSAETPSAETPKPTPAFSFTPKTTFTPASGGLFSGTSTGTPKFSFGSNATGGSQLGATASTPFSFPSLNNSRASTPGLSAGETSAAETSAAEGDDEAPKLEQQKDLCALTEQEIIDEEVLWEALKSKGRVLQKNESGTNEWVTRGIGPLRILKNKQTGKARLLMRAAPSGKLVLNVFLPPPPMEAKPSPGNAKTVNLWLVEADAPANWYFNFGSPEVASELIKVFNENRPSA